MHKLLHRHRVSFQNAFAGIRWAFSTQPNFRVHVTLSLIALLLCWILGVSATETIVIVFVITLGLSAEMINTSLEAMTDLITSEWRKEAKIAKDVSAGMMLTVAIGAVIIASIIFLPKIALLLGV